MSKLEEKELKSLQENQGKINQVVSNMGAISIQKINLEKSKESLLGELKKIEDEQNDLKKELEEKYGKISVNLESGEYEIIPEQEQIMAVINATSYLLLKDTTVIGHSKNTTFSVNTDLPDATTKQSLGWQEVIPGVKSGTLSIECLTNYQDTLTFDDLAEMLITKEKAVFYFKDVVNPKLIVRGEGFISTIDETAEFETATSFNVEINLTGIFTITDPSEGKTWDNVFDKWEDIATNWEDV